MSSERPFESSASAPALELRRIHKSFGSNRALDDASITVEWGEVHALLGENGAGKSTIMNVASGIYAADEGEILIDGEKARIKNPFDATRYGIGMVHQHFRLVRNFTVAQNILLACEGRDVGIRNIRDASREVAAMGERVGLRADPAVPVARLSVAEQQQVEILKVLLLGARIVILDEPTAVLTEQEAESVLAFVRNLARHGHAVVLITHKLREVTGSSDRVTVMRHGKVILNGVDASGLGADDLARAMVGEEIATVNPPTADMTRERLRISGLTVPARPGESGVGLDGLDLTVFGGEVLGVAGVSGNGQQQLADCLLGLLPASSGSVRLDGVEIGHAGMHARRSLGLRGVPADRFGAGLVEELTVAENFGMTGVRDGAFGRGARFSRRTMGRKAAAAIESMNIMGAAPGSLTRLLSGGNAQKLLLARELDGDGSILLAHSPTRGLDVRACHAVHTLIRNAVNAGMACLLISEDLEEILALSSRIVVLSRGEITASFAGGSATRTDIGRAMLGHA